MSFKPLLHAPALYQVHAFLALAALSLGTVQLAAPKATLSHRTLGYLWIGLMVAIAASSFGIQALRPGHFADIHLITLITLIVLPFVVFQARRGRVRRHAIAMISLFVGALIIAGAFTLLPGRIMHAVVFGAVEVLSRRCG